MAYCFTCGTELRSKNMESKIRLFCTNCGWVYYPQLKVSAAGLIESQGKILLARRRNEPWKGSWYLPAGYVEADEDPVVAAIREVKEEIGLTVMVGQLFGAYYFVDDPRGSGLLLVYRCQAVGGAISLNEEVEAAEYFEPGNLPSPLTGAGHERAINGWRDKAVNPKSVYVGDVR